MQRAVIYRRVSTKEQVANQSLGIQLTKCREHCARSGWKVDRVFTEEGESAKTTDRPEFTRLLEYCREERGRMQYLVVYNLSRFSRNSSDHFAIRTYLRTLGVTLRSVQELFDDSASGEFMETVMAGFAQLDNRVRGERSLAGMKAAAEKGRFVWHAPVGYLNSNEPSLVIDPEKGSLVRTAFELFASGRYTKSQVLKRVRALGLTSRQGKELSPQSFTGLLRNKTYCGVMVSRKWDAELPGDWEPLVSDNTFLAAQAVLAGRRTSTSQRQRDHADFPLRRFIRCAPCGKPITGSWSRGRNKRYSYYHCRTPQCRAVSVRESLLREKFVQLLEGLAPKARYLALFREVVLDVWRQRTAETASLQRKLTERVNRLQRRKDELVEAFVHRKVLDSETYEQRVRREDEGLKLARLELAQAQADDVDVAGLLIFAEHLLTNAAQLWLELDIGRTAETAAPERRLFPGGPHLRR